MRTSRYKYIALLMLCCCIIIVVSCGRSTQVKEEQKEETQQNNEITLTDAQFKIAGIEYGKIEMRSISGIIEASGKLDVPPQSKVSISAPMGGVVKETELLQGSHVKKGQPVAVMQHNDYIQLQQDYKEALSQIEYLKAEYERQGELNRENVNSAKTLQKAKAEYLSTKARMEGLRAKLQLLNINISALENGQIQNSINLYAPIEGYVTKVNVNIGSFVNANDVLFEIVNTEHLHAELTVFEKDVPLLKIGQNVLFTLANETKPRVATVYLIGKEINADRSIQIHCHMNKDDKDLIPGMYLKAVVETDSAHVTALPTEAVVGFEGRHYIFIEDEKYGKAGEHGFKMIEVGAGETELGYTEVIVPREVTLQSRIVCKGAYSLLSKNKNKEEGE